MTSSSERAAPRNAGAAPEASAWPLEELSTGTAGPVTASPSGAPAEREDARAAYARGHADGLEQGRAEALASDASSVETALHALGEAEREVRAAEASWLAAAEENIAALAVAVARHIAGRELTVDATLIADLVRRALSEFPLDQPLRVRMNPHDLSRISAVSPDGANPPALASGREVRWIADARIEPGGCVVEGRNRIVDGDVGRALQRVYERIREETDG